MDIRGILNDNGGSGDRGQPPTAPSTAVPNQPSPSMQRPPPGPDARGAPPPGYQYSQPPMPIGPPQNKPPYGSEYPPHHHSANEQPGAPRNSRDYSQHPNGPPSYPPPPSQKQPTLQQPPQPYMRPQSVAYDPRAQPPPQLSAPGPPYRPSPSQSQPGPHETYYGHPGPHGQYPAGPPQSGPQMVPGAPKPSQQPQQPQHQPQQYPPSRGSYPPPRPPLSIPTGHAQHPQSQYRNPSPRTPSMNEPPNQPSPRTHPAQPQSAGLVPGPHSQYPPHQRTLSAHSAHGSAAPPSAVPGQPPNYGYPSQSSPVLAPGQVPMSGYPRTLSHPQPQRSGQMTPVGHPDEGRSASVYAAPGRPGPGPPSTSPSITPGGYGVPSGPHPQHHGPPQHHERPYQVAPGDPMHRGQYPSPHQTSAGLPRGGSVSAQQERVERSVFRGQQGPPPPGHPLETPQQYSGVPGRSPSIPQTAPPQFQQSPYRLSVAPGAVMQQHPSSQTRGPQAPQSAATGSVQQPLAVLPRQQGSPHTKPSPLESSGARDALQNPETPVRPQQDTAPPVALAQNQGRQPHQEIPQVKFNPVEATESRSTKVNSSATIASTESAAPRLSSRPSPQQPQNIAPIHLPRDNRSSRNDSTPSVTSVEPPAHSSAESKEPVPRRQFAPGESTRSAEPPKPRGTGLQTTHSKTEAPLLLPQSLAQPLSSSPQSSNARNPSTTSTAAPADNKRSETAVLSVNTEIPPGSLSRTPNLESAAPALSPARASSSKTTTPVIEKVTPAKRKSSDTHNMMQVDSTKRRDLKFSPDRHMPANGTGPNPRKTARGSMSSGSLPEKKRVKVRHTQEPVWARKYVSGARLNHENFQLRQAKKIAPPVPQGARPSHNGRASPQRSRSHGGPINSTGMVPGQRFLGQWEPCMSNIRRISGIAESVANFIYANIIQFPNAMELARYGAQFEVEAKLGTLLDRSTNKRIESPVASECVLHESSQINFRSDMTERQHKDYNDALNGMTTTSTANRDHRVPIEYKHRREIDQYFPMPQGSEEQFPPPIRDLIRQQKFPPKVRVTMDQKDPSRIIAQIVKIRLADLSVSFPSSPLDCRVSINIEIKWSGSIKDLDAQSSQAPSSVKIRRQKDRLSYRQGPYQIDLTQVVSSQNGNTKKDHELEVELNPDAILQQGRLILENAPQHGYQALVEGFVENIRMLAQEPSEIAR